MSKLTNSRCLSWTPLRMLTALFQRYQLARRGHAPGRKRGRQVLSQLRGCCCKTTALICWEAMQQEQQLQTGHLQVPGG